MKISSSVLGGVLLVAGTCIGAGMLGLPVKTAASGFFPTIGAFLVVWFFMTCSALAYLEVSLRFKGQTNLITMAGQTLGKGARVVAWITYVMFLYSLMAAYTSGGTSMLANILKIDINNMHIATGIALIFVLPFAFMVYLGTTWVDRINRVLMIGLGLSFVAMCILAFTIGPADEFYSVGESKYLLGTLPILVTAFGYHLLIPTLKTYLNDNVKKLRTVIIFGSLAPLLIYAVWELVVLNLVPTWGVNGLVQMLDSGINPTVALSNALEHHGKDITFFIIWFSFFALTTSFIGVGLGIFDFFSDGLKIHKTKTGRVVLSMLTFAPPFLFTIIYPEGFLLALGYAGIFASILLIIYPVAMAWSARYVAKVPGTYQMFGGKFILVLTLIFGVLVMLADVFERMGVFPFPHN